MAFKLQRNWKMKNSDICVVGKELGFEWNTVCEAIRDEEFYGQDGAGSTYVERADLEDWSEGIIKTILTHIFATNPGVDEIEVMN